MKKLTLVRHAKSSWADPGLGDFERPLNGRGKRDAPRMAERFAERFGPPDLLVSSPAVRARKTAGHFAKALDLAKDDVSFDAQVYGATLDDLLDVVSSLDDAHDDVMLFGHNPGFTDLCDWLTGAGIDNLPTCAVARVELDLERWRDAGRYQGNLVDYDYPKKDED